MLSIVIVKMLDECQDDAESDDIDVQQVLELDVSDAVDVSL